MDPEPAERPVNTGIADLKRRFQALCMRQGLGEAGRIAACLSHGPPIAAPHTPPPHTAPAGAPRGGHGGDPEGGAEMIEGSAEKIKVRIKSTQERTWDRDRGEGAGGDPRPARSGESVRAADVWADFDSGPRGGLRVVLGRGERQSVCALSVGGPGRIWG